jgi:hypothetical protein
MKSEASALGIKTSSGGWYKNMGEQLKVLQNNRTDAQDRCRPYNKCLVFGKGVLDTMILEHHRKLPGAY